MFSASKQTELREGLQYDPSSVPENMKEQVEKALKWEGVGFDLRTHIVEPKTGQLLKYQPYRRVVDGRDGTYYIRRSPDGVERRYNENGHPLEAAPSPSVSTPIVAAIAAGAPAQGKAQEHGKKLPQ
jgi:hypothetical protein